MIVISIQLSGGLAPTYMNPMLGPYPTVLNTLGAKNTALIAYQGEWWRLFTPMLLHAGYIHLAVNVLMQVLPSLSNRSQSRVYARSIRHRRGGRLGT